MHIAVIILIIVLILCDMFDHLCLKSIHDFFFFAFVRTNEPLSFDHTFLFFLPLWTFTPWICCATLFLRIHLCTCFFLYYVVATSSCQYNYVLSCKCKYTLLTPVAGKLPCLFLFVTPGTLFALITLVVL